jgi:hypothetical protein
LIVGRTPFSSDRLDYATRTKTPFTEW